MTATPGSIDAAPRLLVACLCAAWCGSCRDYRPTFDALAAEFAGQADFTWVDVEDEADRLGDLDVENFPTLLLARGDVLQFVGPVAPHHATAARLIRSALAGEGGPADHGDLPADLATRVRAVACLGMSKAPFGL